MEELVNIEEVLKSLKNKSMIKEEKKFYKGRIAIRNFNITEEGRNAIKEL